MLRTALKPRWLGLLAVVLLIASAMAGLGQWQFARARAESVGAQRQALSRAPVPLTSLFGPRTMVPVAAVDRPVTLRGVWVPGERVLVANRRADESRPDLPLGHWVVMAFRLDSGAEIAVVRGWTSRPDAPVPTVARGEGAIELTGVLRLTDPPVERDPGEGSGLSPGTLEGVDGTALIALWPEPLYTGYLVPTTPMGTLAGLTPVSPLHGGSGLAWRNISYALQWWLFAAFGLFIWGRLVRDDSLGLVRPSASPVTVAPSTSDITSPDHHPHHQGVRP